MKQIIIIPDSFKGTLDAPAVCEAMRRGVNAVWPDCRTVLLPIADGGEGTVDCFLRALPGAVPVRAEVTGPFDGETVTARYARAGQTAVIEMAAAAGLPMVEGREDPCRATTRGVGELIAHAAAHGARRIILGLGGSCTNDCGVGMAAALGARFFDRTGRPFLPRADTLEQVARLDCSAVRKRLAGIEIVAMCDIDNPLYGPRGAAYVFAPQKGASPAVVARLDENLRAIAALIRRELGLDVQRLPGAGAAGGLGAGVSAFLGGRLQSGIDTVLDLTGFDRLLAGTDLVLTGEGRCDSQSLHGKALAGIARRTRAAGVPLAVFAGAVGDDLNRRRAAELGVSAVFPIHPAPGTFAQVRGESAPHLTAAVANAMGLLRAVGL